MPTDQRFGISEPIMSPSVLTIWLSCRVLYKQALKDPAKTPDRGPGEREPPRNMMYYI